MSETRAELQDQLNTLQQQLAAANIAYTASLTNAEVQYYSFDSGEGKQAVTRRKPAELSKEIGSIKRQIAVVKQRLNGTGIYNMTLRRR